MNPHKRQIKRLLKRKPPLRRAVRKAIETGKPQKVRIGKGFVKVTP